MSAKQSDKHILIVSDSADELRAVHDLMTADLGGYRSTDNEAAGLLLFQEHHPSVLILCFQEIEKAERFYLTLYRQCPQMQEIPHQTLLLCKNTEAESAYALCTGGTMDDYVVNRPLYDPFRLRLSVRQALDRCNGEQQSSTVNRQLANIGSDLRHLDNFVGKKLATGGAQHEESLRTFQSFAAKLTNQISQFEKHLSTAAMGNVVKVLDQGGLRRQFDQLCQKIIEPEGHQMEAKLRDAGAWIQDLATGYRNGIEPIRKDGLPPALPEVMVVDDDEIYREMLIAIIDGGELRAIAVENGEAALAKLRVRRPAVVLMDYQMPGLDGLTTLRQMRKNPDLRSVPVIMLTGTSERELVEQCIQAGAAGFIVKPSDRNTILTKINTLLKPRV
jgi:CheY-like chemotaxis protein